MFTIGEFSRITQLSIKALRIYHERKILIPAKIDEDSGYRYYSKQNIDKAQVILYLKQMQFSLEEIGEILNSYEDDAEIIEFLEKQRDTIQKKIVNLKNTSQSLESIILREKEIKMKYNNCTFEVEEKVLETQLIASLRIRGKYSECGEGFKKIGKTMGRQLTGKPLNLYYDGEYKEDDADIEVCIPVRKGIDHEEIKVRELKGGQSITLLHKGPYEELTISYEKLYSYAQEKGLNILLPTREVYIKGPGMIFRGNPKNYITEIQMLIEKT